MPLYEYRCRECQQDMTAICPIDKRDQQTCVNCGSVMHRFISAPRVNGGWKEDWKFPNLNEQKNQDFSSFGSETEYKRHLEKNNAFEKSLGIREI